MQRLVNEDVLRDEIRVLKIKLAETEETVIQLKKLLMPTDWEPPIELGLTAQQAIVLGCLYKNAPEPVSKDRLMYALYSLSDKVAEPKTIDVFVCKLRKKVDIYGVSVHTAWARGYYLDKASLDILNNWGIDPNESEAN